MQFYEIYVVISIYIYRIYIIREIQDMRSITFKLLLEEWTIEVEKIVDKKILRDNLVRVVTTGSMKSFVKYCRFLIARHWRIARNVWKLLDEFERASFLYARKTRVSSLQRLINFKKLIANVRQYLYQRISLARDNAINMSDPILRLFDFEAKHFKRSFPIIFFLRFLIYKLNVKLLERKKKIH